MIKKEGFNIEFKEAIPKKHASFKAEIVSFLNSDTGGTIYLGVDDDGKEIEYSSKEAKHKQYKEWEELLCNWISSAFRPEINRLVRVDPNHEPFKISIDSGNNKPYYYTDGEGVNYKGIYIRTGSSKRLASDAEVRRMMQRSIANTFDSEKIDIENLNFDYVKKVFENEELVFDIIGLNFKNNSEDRFNNASLIVSDDSPYVSKTAIYNGLDVTTFKDKKSFEGSIVKQIDETLQYIHLNNKVNVTFGQDGRRIEKYSYPVDAVREAVINAFVHRDYTMTSDIKIEIYDDRLSISSPGSLPDGLTVEDIKNGANAKRNPILIKSLDKMNYIENYGSGIRRIYSLYKGFKRQPELVSTHNLFTVILYNTNYSLNSMELNDHMLSIVEYLNDGKIVSRKEIQDALNLQKSYTAELISDLKKNGLLGSEGRGPATRYYLKSGIID